MRYHYLRFDIWLCLLISVLISFIPVKIMEGILPKAYESYEEEHTVAAGQIGGTADETIYRAQNVEDLLSHDTFTVISPGIEYRNRGGGYYDGYYMHSLILPSGERVAARINEDAVQRPEESIYRGDTTLPVGRIVYEDLTQNPTFIHQIEYTEPLTRKDFYVDMLGGAAKLSKEDYTQMPIMLAQIITVVIAFPILHAIGAKIGIFPYFIAPKKKQESEWK